MKETPSSWIRGQNRVNKELQETVGSGKPTGSVLKETIAVSEQTWMSAHNRHSRILLRVFRRSRVWRVLERQKPKWQIVSMAMQGLPHRKLHQFILWHKKWWQKCSGHVEGDWFARKRMATCCQPWRKSREIGETRHVSWHLSWVETRTCWTHIIERTTFGLCPSKHAAEVYSPEVHRHAETNPTCETHESYCTSHKNSRPIHRLGWFAQVNLTNAAPKLQNLRI